MIRTAELYTKYPGDKGTRYYKYIPSNGVKPIGTILFYHGFGERSTTDLTLVDNNGLPAFLKVDGVKDGIEIPFIVLCPQEEPPQEWWGRAIDCVKLAQTFNLPIHKCGLSLGSMVDAEIEKDLSGSFSTIATCCGKINEYPNTFTEFGKIPTLHGYDASDKTIANGYASVKSMHDRLKSAGKDSTFIEYTGIGHEIWTKFYDSKQATNYISWLMSKVSAPPVPVKDLVIEQYLENGSLYNKTQSGKILKVTYQEI